VEFGQEELTGFVVSKLKVLVISLGCQLFKVPIGGKEDQVVWINKELCLIRKKIVPNSKDRKIKSETKRSRKGGAEGCNHTQ